MLCLLSLHWLIDWLIDRLIVRSFDWSVDWLISISSAIDSSFVRLIDWLIEWLIVCWIDWLIDWLIDALHAHVWWQLVSGNLMVDWLIDWFHWEREKWKIQPSVCPFFTESNNQSNIIELKWEFSQSTNQSSIDLRGIGWPFSCACGEWVDWLIVLERNRTVYWLKIQGKILSENVERKDQLSCKLICLSQCSLHDGQPRINQSINACKIRSIDRRNCSKSINQC